jgi:reversibly glycosylated polypeptide/UDP-arabinopyranose mutase
MTLNKTTTNVEDLYLEMADKVRKGLGHIDPYFSKLADGMEAWIAGWRMLNPPKAA